MWVRSCKSSPQDMDWLPASGLAILRGEAIDLPDESAGSGFAKNLFEHLLDAQFGRIQQLGIVGRLQRRRSEEHTSELQSRENLVCRLLLEKKNLATVFRRPAKAM